MKKQLCMISSGSSEGPQFYSVSLCRRRPGLSYYGSKSLSEDSIFRAVLALFRVSTLAVSFIVYRAFAMRLYQIAYCCCFTMLTLLISIIDGEVSAFAILPIEITNSTVLAVSLSIVKSLLTCCSVSAVKMMSSPPYHA